MRKFFCLVMIFLAASALSQTRKMTPAQVKLQERRCCNQYKSTGVVTDRCKSALSDLSECDAYHAELEKARAEARAAQKMRESREIIFHVIGGLCVLALFVLLYIKKRKKSPKDSSPRPPPQKRKPPRPKLDLGGYE